MSETTITIAAGLAGATTNMDAIVAEVQRQIEVVRTHDRAVEDALAAIYETLNEEQQALFRTYEKAVTDREFEQLDLYILDLGRHLPGLHPAIWALSRHMFESKQGECCLPEVTAE
jgi:hypothetical protein